MDKIRGIMAVVLAAVGGFIANIFGGWTSALTTLVIFMAIDWLTGLIVAGVFHASKKSESGALQSSVGWKGLCRKCVTLALVMIAGRLDLAMGTAFCKDATIIGFIVNEVISIMENAGLMGIQYPTPIRKALDVLNQRIEEKPPDKKRPDGDENEETGGEG